MLAISEGKYAHVPIPDPGPARRVDIDEMYNVERFRPQYHNRLGRPMLLASQVGSPVLTG